MISQNLIDLIKESEGFYAKPYLDISGVPTIGFGFTHYPDGAKVTMDDAPMGESYAASILNQFLEQYIKGVNALVPNCNQNQKDALVSFAYNLGLGALQKSTLLKMILANPNDRAITEEMLKWCHAGGEVVKGLWLRRQREATLYFTPMEVVS